MNLVIIYVAVSIVTFILLIIQLICEDFTLKELLIVIMLSIVNILGMCLLIWGYIEDHVPNVVIWKKNKKKELL